jgi:hypothetical protein
VNNHSLCVARTANGGICQRDAHYVCSGGHTLCPNHAIRLGGLRRKTDRKCRTCGEARLRSTIRAIMELAIGVERRRENLQPVTRETIAV